MSLLALCAATIIINSSGLKWDDYDESTYYRAVNRCSYYYPNSPCLSKLEKKGFRRYWATCSKPEKK